MKKILLPTIISLLITLFPYNSAHAQSANLENLSAVVNTLEINASAEMDVTFKLPFNASPVRRTDYIQLILTNFKNVSEPAYIEGTYAGTPSYIITGSTVKITGISMVPGAQITIRGIPVENPAVDEYWTIVVQITEDEAGTIIKNERIINVTLFEGAISVTAIIETPQAQLNISGETGPTTYVTFTELGAVTGTDISGLDGHFGKIFTGLEPTTHQISFYGTDPNHLTTSPINISVYTAAFAETSITNQLLSPTIMLNQSVYSDGADIIASGSAVPNGDITLITQAPLRSYSTTVDSEGNWSYTITNTEEYVPGDYQIHALVQSSGGLTSLHSPSLGFTINSTIGSIGTACGEISNGDINCDDLVDLTDFSILMYYWGTSNAIADINVDSRVDITDFSIMMYWWGT